VDDLSKPPTKPDSLDVILREAVAAPPVLMPEVVIGEHYLIERVLGAGGMGTVYLARDLDLGRPVAIKVHRITTDSSRLHREAVAMARLAHPNVVTVYEVGDHEGHPFVAMEYVEGENFRSWLASGRTRTEILDVLLAAGTGLAAAHAAELVHRDVKPDNILLGRDGRARIGDFGLAQASETGEPLQVPLGNETATGAVIGTPAYMAPEQIDGGLVDARSDQFAFCVAAWEALGGERPFDGEDTTGLRDAIKRAMPPPTRRSIPAGLRQVLLRGLAFDPAKRWPSMPALLAALRSARRRRRVMIGAAVALAVAAPIALWSAWPGPDPLLACDTRASTLEVVVPPASAAALVAAADRANGPASFSLAKPIERALTGVYARAVAVTDTTCRAEVTHKWSAEMVAASRECALDHATSVREMLASLPPTRENLTSLAIIAIELPPIEPCADPRVLAGWRSLGPAIIEARAQIARAVVDVNVGRFAQARSLAAAIERTPVAADRAVSGRLEQLRASIEIANGEYAAAERRLEGAYLTARESEDASIALTLVVQLVHVTSNLRRDPVAARRWITEGLADAKREQSRYAAEASRVYEEAALAAVEIGDGKTALERCDAAEALLRATNPRIHMRFDAIRSDAHAMLGETDEALAASDRDISTRRDLLGPQHPDVAVALGNRAALLLEIGKSKEAADAVATAVSIMDAVLEDHAESVVALQITVGAVLLDIGDRAGVKYLERARASRVAQFGEDHPDVALVDSNLALTYLDDGQPERALAALRHAVKVQEKILGPDHLELAVTLYNLAVAERTTKDYAAAAATARRAVAIYEKRQPGASRHVAMLGLVAQIENVAGHPELALAAADTAIAIPPAEDLQGPAWVRLEAARALITLKRELPRARKLLGEARGAYQAANMTERAAETEALLAKLP